MENRIRIGVVDDHPLFREGVIHILAAQGDMAVVGQGATADDAVRIAKESHPDVIVLDLTLEGDAIAAVETIAMRHPSVNVLMLTVVADEECVTMAMQRGARGYLLKGVSGPELIGTVRADPATVEIIGAPSALANITEAITEPVSVAGAAGSFTDTVAVGSADPSVRLRAGLSARVAVTITAAPAEWTVEGVAVQIRNAGRTTRVMPRTVTVFVRGPQESRSVGAGDFDAYVDVEGLGSGDFELAVRVVPPPKVGVVRVMPERVGVGIR